MGIDMTIGNLYEMQELGVVYLYSTVVCVAIYTVVMSYVGKYVKLILLFFIKLNYYTFCNRSEASQETERLFCFIKYLQM